MREILGRCEVFRGLEDRVIAAVAATARRRSFDAGEYAFVLGQTADHLFVVLSGRIDLCIPISIDGSMKDVTLESKGSGSALGWSAFVKPHRFRLSARAAEASVLADLPREELSRLFDSEREAGRQFMERVAEITAQRLLTVQALWVRELQRSVLGAGAAPQARG